MIESEDLCLSIDMFSDSFLSTRLLQRGDIVSNNNNNINEANQPGGRVGGELKSLLLLYLLYQGIEPENPEHLG